MSTSTGVPCEGRPGLACPENRRDKTVRLSQGDLMLCLACERFRFPESFDQRPQLASTKKDAIPVKIVSNKANDQFAGEKSQKDNDSLISTSAPAAAIIVNELLSYVNFFRDRSSAEMTKKVIAGFYLPAEITQAKKSLINSLPASTTDCPMKAERRSSTTRKAHEAELDDIIGLFDFLDGQSALGAIKFHSTALDRLPGVYGPEDINIAVIADRQVRIDAKVEQLASSVADSMIDNNAFSVQSISDITQSVDKLNCRFIELSDGLQYQMKALSETCQQLAASVRKAPSLPPSPHPPSARNGEVDRSKNVVINGVPENQDSRIWLDSVAEVLKVITGNNIEISDAFRLGGRFVTGKVRPVLVKLKTVWDRRLVVIGANKLAQCEEYKRIYVSPDEPLDVRRKATLERLKKRAERERKTVNFSNGVLSIDNEVVFSLTEGFLKNLVAGGRYTANSS